MRQLGLSYVIVTHRILPSSTGHGSRGVGEVNADPAEKFVEVWTSVLKKWERSDRQTDRKTNRRALPMPLSNN